MRTVREVFNEAFGPVPDGAECYIANYVDYEGSHFEPTYRVLVEGTTLTFGSKFSTVKKGRKPEWVAYTVGEDGWKKNEYAEASGANVTDCPAENYRGFFEDDDRYDKVLDKYSSPTIRDMPIVSGYHWARKKGCHWVVVNVISSGVLGVNSYTPGFVVFTDGGQIRDCNHYDEYIIEPIRFPI